MPFFFSRRKLEIEISRRASEACDQVIAEMGAELHDDLIQKLSILRLYIDRLERSFSDPSEVQLLATKMRGDFDLVTRAVKTTSRRLFLTNMDSESLEGILEILCQNMEKSAMTNIHFEHSGATPSLEDKIKIHLFRIVQELIHNALKHSSAWHIWVRLISEANYLIIEVEDDGSGATKIPEFINRLKRKNNTLKMRTQAIGASIDYFEGAKGLLARVRLNTK